MCVDFMRSFSLSFTGLLLALFITPVSPLTARTEERPLLPRIEGTPEAVDSSLPEIVIDEALVTLILGDDKLCCRISRIDPRIGELVWGPLYWRRLKILCPGIRPVAIC